MHAFRCCLPESLKTWGFHAASPGASIKGSILVEISEVLDTSVNYLLGQEECDEDLLKRITVYKSLKDPKIKGIALEQMKLLATIHPER